MVGCMVGCGSWCSKCLEKDDTHRHTHKHTQADTSASASKWWLGKQIIVDRINIWACNRWTASHIHHSTINTSRVLLSTHSATLLPPPPLPIFRRWEFIPVLRPASQRASLSVERCHEILCSTALRSSLIFLADCSSWQADGGFLVLSMQDAVADVET